MHKQELIHTDLKPENILFTRPLQTISGLGNVVPECTDIRLIDFGNSTFSKSYHSNVIATRHYRPPEVLMNIGWSYPCDIWAVGCILLEMYTGQVIFAPRDDYEHLAMIEKVISPIPSKMGRQARYIYLNEFILKNCFHIYFNLDLKQKHIFIQMVILIIMMQIGILNY